VRLAPLPTTATTTPPRYIHLDWPTIFTKLVPFLHDNNAMDDEEFGYIREVGRDNPDREQQNNAIRFIFNDQAFPWKNPDFEDGKRSIHSIFFAEFAGSNGPL
jgi:hypothetical protein